MARLCGMAEMFEKSRVKETCGLGVWGFRVLVVSGLNEGLGLRYEAWG